jgi:hypothetical protein
MTFKLFDFFNILLRFSTGEVTCERKSKVCITIVMTLGKIFTFEEYYILGCDFKQSDNSQLKILCVNLQGRRRNQEISNKEAGNMCWEMQTGFWSLRETQI